MTPVFIFKKMEVETVIYMFTLCGIVVLYLGSALYKQKIINVCLKNRIRLLSKLKFYESKIEQRQMYLNQYDLQKFNLKDVLISQYFGKI